MATTITTAIASTVTLAAGYTTITSSGTIRPTSSGGYSARAVRVFSGFTLANAGQIQGSTFATTSGIGIEVFAPGTIINSGQIYGSNAFGAYAIKSSTAGLTVINSGIIGHGSLSAAIVTNQATGVIATGLLTASSVTNAGTIGALVAAGVGSGSLMALVATNAATGVMALNSTTISSGGGIAGQLTNDGSIQSNLGITLRGNGTITNNATGIMRSNAVAVSAPTANGFLYAANQTVINAGLIAGGTGGVNFADVAGGSATLVNTGTISTTSGYAVFFTGLLTTRLVVGAAAAFIGTVKSASTASTLELQAPVGTGTISGIGTSFVGFKTIQIDNGATASQWRLNGSVAGFNGTTISGWDPVDQIDITDQTVASVGFSAGVLSFFDAGHSQIGSVTLSGSLVGITNANQFTLIGDGGAGTVIRQSGLISGTVSGTTGLVNNQTVTVASTGILSGGGFTAVSSAFPWRASRPLSSISRRPFVASRTAKSIKEFPGPVSKAVHSLPRPTSDTLPMPPIF